MSLFHTQVTLDGYDFPDFQFTVLLNSSIQEINTSGWSDATGWPTGASIGLPLTWDGTTPNQMRLSGAGDEISAALQTIENRVVEGHNVGVATFKFARLMPIDQAASGGAIPVVGSRVKGGATAGTVKACDGTEAFFAQSPRVVEIRGTNAVVVKF